MFCEGPDLLLYTMVYLLLYSMWRGSHSPNRICIPLFCVTCQKSTLLLHAGILENSQFADPLGELKVVILTENNIMERVVLTISWINQIYSCNL